MRRHGLQIGIDFKIGHTKRETCRSNNGDVCRVVELLVHNRAVVFPCWGLEKLELDQVLGVEWLASARVHLVPLDEGHNILKSNSQYSNSVEPEILSTSYFSYPKPAS